MLNIYNKISDYIVVLNYNGEIIFANESFLKRLNYNNEEVLNLKIDKITRFKKNNLINIYLNAYQGLVTIEPI